MLAESAGDVQGVPREHWSSYGFEMTIDAANAYVEMRRDGAGLFTHAGDMRGSTVYTIGKVELRALRQSSSARIDARPTSPSPATRVKTATTSSVTCG